MANKVSKAPVVALVDHEEKLKALDAALTKIEKDCGKGSIMKLGDAGVNKDIEVVPTGSLSVDIALGAGGFPRGRIIEIYGPESSGKTTLALHAVAEVQKRGGIAAFIDAEHALDPRYAQAIGVDIDNLYVSQPDSGEQALDIAETMVRSGAMDILVVARLMSMALRKLTAIISKSNCILIFINQLREKVGVMFGSPETTTGGRALKFYASVRIDIRKGESIKAGEGEFSGNRVKVKIAKNKIAPPFKQVEFDISFGSGISKEGEILDLAVEKKMIEKSGAWFAYQGNKIGQGRENAKAFLKDHPKLMAELEKELRKEYGLKEDPYLEAVIHAAEEEETAVDTSAQEA